MKADTTTGQLAVTAGKVIGSGLIIALAIGPLILCAILMVPALLHLVAHLPAPAKLRARHLEWTPAPVASSPRRSEGSKVPVETFAPFAPSRAIMIMKRHHQNQLNDALFLGILVCGGIVVAAPVPAKDLLLIIAIIILFAGMMAITNLWNRDRND